VIRPAAIQRLNAAYRGRAREEAYLELAQEHFLDWLRVQGLTDEITFKGGTSLRKFVFGLDGRFSHDLDFSIPNRAGGELVIEALSNGFTHEGVAFTGSDIDTGAMKASWVAEAVGLGPTRLACRLDFSTRPTLLPPVERPRALLPSVTASDLDFEPVMVRIADLRETCAEKLARFRRIVFARDVYDINHLTPFVRDDLLVIRELLFYKVYFDVVDDGRGTAPFQTGTEFVGKTVDKVRGAEELGAMTGKPVDMESMLKLIGSIFGAMRPASTDRELVITKCNRGDRFQVQTWHDELRAEFYGRG